MYGVDPLIKWPVPPYSQKLKRIKIFDLSSVVKPLPLGKLESLSTAAFKRILNCESKLRQWCTVHVHCIDRAYPRTIIMTYCTFFTEGSLHRAGSEVSYLMSTGHCCTSIIVAISWNPNFFASPPPPQNNNTGQDNTHHFTSYTVWSGVELKWVK